MHALCDNNNHFSYMYIYNYYIYSYIYVLLHNYYLCEIQNFNIQGFIQDFRVGR